MKNSLIIYNICFRFPPPVVLCRESCVGLGWAPGSLLARVLRHSWQGWPRKLPVPAHRVAIRLISILHRKLDINILAFRSMRFCIVQLQI